MIECGGGRDPLRRIAHRPQAVNAAWSAMVRIPPDNADQHKRFILSNLRPFTQSWSSWST
jgi:hypothetical protein